MRWQKQVLLGIWLCNSLSIHIQIVVGWIRVASGTDRYRSPRVFDLLTILASASTVPPVDGQSSRWSYKINCVSCPSAAWPQAWPPTKGPEAAIKFRVPQRPGKQGCPPVSQRGQSCHEIPFPLFLLLAWSSAVSSSANCICYQYSERLVIRACRAVRLDAMDAHHCIIQHFRNLNKYRIKTHLFSLQIITKVSLQYSFNPTLSLELIVFQPGSIHAFEAFRSLLHGFGRRCRASWNL